MTELESGPQESSRTLDTLGAGLFVSFEEPLREPSALRGAGSHLCIELLNSAKSRSAESRITSVRKAKPYCLIYASLNEFFQNVTTILVFAHKGPHQGFLEMKDAL